MQQQGTGAERIVAKSKPTLNLVSHSAASSPTAPSSSASSRPGVLRAPSRQGSNLIAQSAGKFAVGGSNQNDAPSSSQVWLTDAKTNDSARKLAAEGTNKDPSFQECARKLAAENSDINDEDDSKWPQNDRISRANVQRTVKQLFDVTRKLVKHQKEIQGISMINWQEISWKRTTLLTDWAVRLSTAKASVFSD